MNETIENKYKVLENYIGTQLTYKELCEILDWKHFTGGTSKKAQFKELNRYVQYKIVGERKGLRYMIIEIYNEILEKMDNRKIGNNNKYGQDIETTMLYILHNYENDHMYVSCGKALEIANIVNDNYRITRQEIPLASKLLNIDQAHLYNFYDTYHQELIRTFERGLKYMRNRCCILWDKVTIVAKEFSFGLSNSPNPPVLIKPIE